METLKVKVEIERAHLCHSFVHHQYDVSLEQLSKHDSNDKSGENEWLTGRNESNKKVRK